MAGISRRLVRSPEAPKMTKVQGGATAVPLAVFCAFGNGISFIGASLAAGV